MPAQTTKTVLEQLLLMSGWMMGGVAGTLSSLTVTLTTIDPRDRYLAALALIAHGLLLSAPAALSNHPPTH